MTAYLNSSGRSCERDVPGVFLEHVGIFGRRVAGPVYSIHGNRPENR